MCEKEITTFVPKLLSSFDFLKYFIFNFDLKYFCFCYIILDKNYTNENTFKTQFIHIFSIKYYITETKKFKVKFKKERL